jgi:adenylate cyclase
MRLVIDGWADAPETSRRKAIDLARQALEVAENDPDVLVHAALVLAYFDEDIGAMIALVDRALALNPSYARGWFLSGIIRTFAGQPDVAIEHIETALRLSPRPEAAPGHSGESRLSDPYRTLAACYAHMGRLDEARAIVARLRSVTPLVVPSLVQFRKPEDRELLLSGLRLAAGETT